MRYLPLTDADREAMLAAIGVASVDQLYRDVPADALLSRPAAGFGTAGVCIGRACVKCAQSWRTT